MEGTDLIPTKTLRARMTEAMYAKIGNDKLFPGELGGKIAAELAQAAIDAIEDPCLIKTADSLEPTFTLRAQDKAAEYALREWRNIGARFCDRNKPEAWDKLEDARLHVRAFCDWPTRKWPD